jgi:hypothetical protein
MLHKIFVLFFITAFPFLGGLFVLCKAPKRAMHKAGGGLMESTTDTNRKQGDKLQHPEVADSKYCDGENAC